MGTYIWKNGDFLKGQFVFGKLKFVDYFKNISENLNIQKCDKNICLKKFCVVFNNLITMQTHEKGFRTNIIPDSIKNSCKDFIKKLIVETYSDCNKIIFQNFKLSNKKKRLKEKKRKSPQAFLGFEINLEIQKKDFIEKKERELDFAFQDFTRNVMGPKIEFSPINGFIK